MFVQFTRAPKILLGLAGVTLLTLAVAPARAQTEVQKHSTSDRVGSPDSAPWRGHDPGDTGEQGKGSSQDANSEGTSAESDVEGACCLEGKCILTTTAECEASGGFPRAPGTVCLDDNNPDGVVCDCVADSECPRDNVCFVGVCCEPGDLDCCLGDVDCEATVGSATANICVQISHLYADVDNDGDVDLFDFFCILNCFSGAGPCTLEDCDIAPCVNNGVVDLFDIFAVLSPFHGIDPCCSCNVLCAPPSPPSAP